jgi:hypothetical protein
MLVQLVWLPAFLIWSIIIVAFDLLVIYAIATAWPDWRTADSPTTLWSRH